MGRKVRVAVAGVGNCASALIQGTRYYRNNSKIRKPDKDWIGLTAYDIGGIDPSDIEFVAAFDVAD
ncbi:MAG: inositol-3-phosphate synthase, partial [Thaumarchaeota archaeon]